MSTVLHAPHPHRAYFGMAACGEGLNYNLAAADTEVTCPKCRPPATIDRFDGEHRFLSNFWPSPIVVFGTWFPTAEHAYQGLRTSDRYTRYEIARLTTPGRAKRAGAKLPPWPSDERRLLAMQHVLDVKFSLGTQLAAMLRSTGTAQLVEGNTWGDTFWGVCNGEGANHLGRLLMEARSLL